MSQSTAELEKRSRKSYTTEKKIEIISFAKKNSIHKASIKYALDRKNIRRWINKEAELTKLKSSVTSGSLRKRLDGGGRHVKEVELEKRLVLWVQDERKKKHRVSRRMIFREGRILLKHIESERGIDSTLKLSVGWLEKFTTRNNLSYRKPTSVAQKPPSDYANVLVKYIVELGARLEQEKYDQIIACDEIGVWLDSVGGLCFEEKGSREVTVLTTGHEKTRITVMLTACLKGNKLIPFVILPKKRKDPKLEAAFKNKLKISYGGTNKSWMDNGLKFM